MTPSSTSRSTSRRGCSCARSTTGPRWCSSAVIVAHLARVFFTGAFRRPRELNWLIGFGLLTFAIAEGFTGYSLPDDLLSGTGARIAYSAVISVPFLGPYLASLVFGGEFPTAAIPAPVLRPARDAAAGAVRGRDRGPCRPRVPPEAHAAQDRPRARGQRRRPPLLARPGVRVRRPVLPHRGGAWRCWAASCRSTRCGRTARSSPRSSRRRRSPTGTWAGSTAPFGSSRRSSP